VAWPVVLRHFSSIDFSKNTQAGGFDWELSQLNFVERQNIEFHID